jgi:uncharacterized membrane protein YgdD (TMEM256/DUF423 family)
VTAARGLIVLAALAGFSGVLLAAIGAHAVPAVDEVANYRSWQSASLLHLLHAAVLLTLGMRVQRHPSRVLLAAATLMLLGVVLFSGSIYTRILLDLERSFNLAPVGGFALMLGWLLIPFGLLRR